MIWIIGGTSEARSMIDQMAGTWQYIVTVATYSGAEVLNNGNVVVQRMNMQGMVDFIAANAIRYVIDLSHPYAVEVTQNAKAACNHTGTPYLRFVRRGAMAENAVHVAAIEDCAAYLRGITGTVFFTTGIKNIKDFEQVRGSNRFIYRVLPSTFSIQECLDNQVKMQDIVAILGPISEELNYQMFKDYGASYVVMKDSGKEGGTSEKLQACSRLGINAVVIGRQTTEQGFSTINELMKALKEMRGL